MEDLLTSIYIKFHIVHEPKKGSKFYVKIPRSFTDHGSSFHPLDNHFQPVHRLGGGGSEPDGIDFMSLVIALTGDTVGGRGTGGKPIVFHPQVGRAIPAATAVKEKEKE